MYKTFFNNVGIIDLGSGKIKAGTSNSEEPTVYDSLIGRPKYQKVSSRFVSIFRICFVHFLCEDFKRNLLSNSPVCIPSK